MTVATNAVLINAGDQLPVIPFVEVEGKNNGVEFWHTGPRGAKVGVIGEDVMIFIVAADAH